MFSNRTIGRFFSLMGAMNTLIRENTTYGGNMRVANSQRNEFISDLFHNLGFIGEPIQAGNETAAYYHVQKHIDWFNALNFTQISVFKDLKIDIEEIKDLFSCMKEELEPHIKFEILEELRTREQDDD